MTITFGTNCLIGDDPAAIARIRLAPHAPGPCRIPLWDGLAGRRIADVLTQTLLSPSAVALSASARARATPTSLPSPDARRRAGAQA